ncbi:hypothetical protein C1X65_26320 [Pseudomonas sp. FW305-70]|nr:hypothetical protein C1X65_26320 [Pseudomonas sp. FW305-70]
MNTVPVARELAPAGARSGPSFSLKSRGLLRSPAGASSLATDYLLFAPASEVSSAVFPACSPGANRPNAAP